MEMGLAGKVALVTGASKGVGRAAALMLAAEGCDLIIVARSAADLGTVREDILARTDRTVTVMACDISESRTPADIVAQHPDVDILVNNAGAIPPGAIDAVDDGSWRKAWDLKVFGYIGLTRSYYPRMATRRSGVILNVMGASGERPGPATIAIGMANATLNAMTKAIGGISPSRGVRVVGINPGPIATERGVAIMQDQAMLKLGNRDRWRELTSDMPFGRFAEPAEVAAAIVFLVSDRASYISGAVLSVDGGVTSKVTTY